MPRTLFDSEYIFGIHEPGGEQHMTQAGKPGWILFTEELGHDPNNQSGKDFTRWSNQNLGIICRINNGYGSAGTIPNSQQYDNFARRCANYVRASRGCKIWIIGNEMNYDVERPPASASRSAAPAPASAPAPSSVPATPTPTTEPGTSPQQEPKERGFWGWLFGPLLNFISRGMGDAELYAEDAETVELGDPFNRSDPNRFSALRSPESDNGDETSANGDSPVRAASAAARSGKEVITPQLYADCYRRCRDAIHAVPGHEDDQVLIGSVAPWNNQTQYAGNSNGDWIQYFKDILNILGPNGCDGITIHAYTHGADPNLVHSSAKMNAPFQNYHYHFRTYQDFMNAVPIAMRHLPVYLTEADEDVAWLNRNIGWVQRAYGEIDHWNKQAGNQQIRCMILYRWPQIDKWYIEGKQGVVDDFREALRNPYKWQVTLPSTLSLRTGNRVQTLDIVNLRRSPGYVNKPGNDILAQVPENAVLEVLDGQSSEDDDLVWWNVRIKDASQKNIDGWLSQFSPTGIPLLEKTTKGTTSLGETIVGSPSTGSGSGSGSGTEGSTGTAPVTQLAPGQIGIGGGVRTLDIVRMRQTPGFRNKGIGDTVDQIAAGTTLQVVGGPQTADGLTWWEASGSGSQGGTVRGWMAESANGIDLLEAVSAPSSGGNVGTGPSNPTTGQFALGETLHTLDIVKLRRSPGFFNKPTTDTIADIREGVNATVTGGPIDADGLTWWKVNTTSPSGTQVSGWMAESVGDNILLAKGATDDNGRETGNTGGKFNLNQRVRTLDIVRMRRTPGFVGASSSDIVADIPVNTVGRVIGGPQNADGLTWWRVEAKTDRGQTVNGWMAESLANGILLLEAAEGSTGGGTGSGPQEPVSSGRFAIGDSIKTADVVRMRRTPGYFDKPETDTVAGIFEGTLGEVIGGPVDEDDLTWWRIETTDPSGRTVTGWIAQDSPTGIPLLQKVDPGSVPPKPIRPSGEFIVDELVYAADDLKVRKTPGFQNKPGDDVLGGFAEETTLNIIEGPQSKDDLPWWRVGGITPVGPDGERIGWVAGEFGGNKLLTDAPKLFGTDIPNKESQTYLGPPTDRVFTIGQLWGENPQFYKQFRPGGVALKGHNGIDWNTPTGSNIISVDAGTIIDTQFDRNGFGNYVVVGHSWGHSIYAHLSSVAVRNGQSVSQGSLLGKAGSTGASTGPHLHFAIRIRGYAVSDGWGGFSDPLPYLPREAIILPHYVLPPQPRSVPSPASAPAPSGTPMPEQVPIITKRLAPSGITVDLP